MFFDLVNIFFQQENILCKTKMNHVKCGVYFSRQKICIGPATYWFMLGTDVALCDNVISLIPS